MSDTWFKIMVWTKLSLIALVLLFILIFTLENYSLTVDVWLFKVHTMSVLELLVATFLLGVLATLLARPIYRTLGQISELKKKMAKNETILPKVESPAPVQQVVEVPPDPQPTPAVDRPQP